MASAEDREKHKRRRTNSIAKDLRSPDGKYKLRVIDPRKEEYKRVRLDPRDIDLEEDDENES